MNISNIKLKNNQDILSTKQVYCLDDKVVYDSVWQLSKILKVDTSLIYNVCAKRTYISSSGKVELCNKTIKGKHYLWYDDFITMTKEEIKNYLKRCESHKKKKVICITTNMIFNSLKEAANFYNISSSSDIIYCCKEKSQSAGKLPDGTKLKWMYYEKYEKILEENDLENGEVEISMEIINEAYKERMLDGTL